VNNTGYYHGMRQLALELRARHGLEGSHLTIRQIWRICRTEGIERLDFRSGFKALRGAYFNDEYGVSILLARGLPDDPTIFTIAHELKHHLVDSKAKSVLCRAAEEARRIEVGAEVFAAELIYPERDFVDDLCRLLGRIPRKVTAEMLAQLKLRTRTTLSYAALAKRTVLLGLAEGDSFQDVRWRTLAGDSVETNKQCEHPAILRRAAT
jgi:Zn-dependent peptidase ImmA (M78 family)